jgi:hypothetical protein
LTQAERQELYDAFIHAGAGMHITELPASYADWRRDRVLHLKRDLVYSKYTERLYRIYRRHLGLWRYQILLDVQASLVPERVRRLLRLNSPGLLAPLVRAYGLLDLFGLHEFVHMLLIPPQYWEDVRAFDRERAA